ncbi:MAG: hypothetical protein IPM82_14850 [Saprospiraceae bacterium]|nr:hypothetical protein [Saprospiraceae bacterium]
MHKSRMILTRKKYWGLDEGLQPILQNIKIEQLSTSDKKAILAKLEQLEQLALQVKKELLKS